MSQLTASDNMLVLIHHLSKKMFITWDVKNRSWVIVLDQLQILPNYLQVLPDMYSSGCFNTKWTRHQDMSQAPTV